MSAHQILYLVTYATSKHCKEQMYIVAYSYAEAEKHFRQIREHVWWEIKSIETVSEDVFVAAFPQAATNSLT